MIVEFSDFKREAKIPDLFPEIGTDDFVNTATQEALQEFIDEYERKYLLQFFGKRKQAYILLREFSYYLEFPEDDKKMTRLIKSLKTIIPNFIAWYWFRNESVQNTGIGAVIPQGENSNRTNNVDRMVFIWNEMVDKTRVLYKEHFDTHLIPERDIFLKINAFGI